MSFRASRWAWRQQAGSSRAKIVLLSLADHVNERGYCWPSQHRLAVLTDLATKTVGRALKDLEDRKLIRRVQRSHDDGGRTSDGIYVVAPLSELRWTRREKRQDTRSRSPGPPRSKSPGAPVKESEEPINESHHIQEDMSASADSPAQGSLIQFAVPIKTASETLTSEKPGGGVGFLIQRGIKRPTAWAMVNKWRKIITDDQLLRIMATAARKNVGNPIEYITKAVSGERRRTRGRSHHSVV